MFNIISRETTWGGKKLRLETGRMARQADGAVLVTYGETQVLATVVASKGTTTLDYFPLTVHYQERYAAAGKIPGGFFRREGRPTEKEVLTSRLIDRPVRPLFRKGFSSETQLVSQVFSYDTENNPDIVAMIASSAALAISGIPFMGPIGAARVGCVDGQFVLNPDDSARPKSTLDLIVAGTSEGVMMVESEAEQLDEEQMLKAVMFGFDGFQSIISLIEDLAAEVAKPMREVTPAPEEQVASITADISSRVGDAIHAAYKETNKSLRSGMLDTVRTEALAPYADDNVTSKLAAGVVKSLEKNIVRGDIIASGSRIDGRGLSDIRPIVAEVNVLHRTHGSALFTRGETQALATLTLGTDQDEQIMDALEGTYREPFLLHYTFPPYSVGEASPMRPPGRREIGHGKLAWRALRPLLPGKEKFPYTLRLTSEVTESNGSSSMATVCASSLAMLQGGVPLKAACAGIAMGLIKEGDDFAVL
ncbi:MAG: polyribonucleotide nucleotidyltransferase, partial [Alphaproteobacteria bacterium]|nr:polyribonucleotide nucleotidyltransferase [Alphaproteobacteria bacterium]